MRQTSAIMIGAIIGILIFRLIIQPYILDRDKIQQDVEMCNDQSHFQIWTYVWHRGEIIGSFRTWTPGKDNCLVADSVQYTKRIEYQKAESFLSLYLEANK